MNFFSLPDNDTFFPSTGSPSAILLRNGTPPSSLHALAKVGMLDPQAASEPDADGVPAFFAWVQSACGMDTPANRRVWQDNPWPVVADGDWSEAILQPEASPLLFRNKAYQAERMAGWFLAQVHEGLLHFRWSPQQNPITETAFSPYPTNTLSVIGALVVNGWDRALDQALRRVDAPTTLELSNLLATTTLYTRYPSVSGEDAHATRLLPLLHYAVEKDELPTVEVLLRAGLNPNSLDGSGTPAFFRTKSREVFQALLDAGARPHIKATHQLTLTQWWTDSLTADQSQALLKMANAWSQTHLSYEELRQEKLPDLMSDLGKTSLTNFRKQLKDLGLSPTVEWQEHGQTWTLGRRALALLLKDNPDPIKRNPSLDWALSSCKSLGEDLLPGTSNHDLLWLTHVGEGPSAAKQAEHKSGPLGSPLADRNRLLGMVEAFAQPSPYGLDEKTSKVGHHHWLPKLGRVLAHNGHEDIALDAWRRFDLPNSSQTENEKKKCLTVSLDKTWDFLKRDDHVNAGRWLGEALWLASGLSVEQILPKYYAWNDDVNQKIQHALEANRSMPFDPYGVQIAQTLQAAQHHGLLLDDGDQGRRLSEFFVSWPESKTMKPVCRLANRIWLDGCLSIDISPSRRPRM